MSSVTGMSYKDCSRKYVVTNQGMSYKDCNRKYVVMNQGIAIAGKIHKYACARQYLLQHPSEIATLWMCIYI